MRDTPTPMPEPAAGQHRHPDSLREILLDAARLLRLHQGLGIDRYPRPPGQAPAREEERQQAETGLLPSSPAVQGPGPEQDALAGLLADIADCHRCPRHLGRTKPLPGSGQPGRKLLIVLDAPSADDDRLGLAVAGEAGELLDRMLAAIGMERGTICLTFLGKCHGPAVPDRQAAAACLPFLHRQIALFSPAVICAMGPESARVLLHREEAISALRGAERSFRGIPLVVTYPPDFLLKNTELKKAAWLDLQLVRKLCAAPGGRRSD